MLKLTRVSGTLDTTRVANAVSRPGIDPRIWVSYAIVNAIALDPDNGLICDITLMPNGGQFSARVGVEYAGNGFGDHSPLAVDDEVLVESIMGDPDHGYVITRRIHSPSDPPSQVVIDNPADRIIVVKADSNLRLVVQGAGNVVIDVQGTGKVQLGGTDVTTLSPALTQNDGLDFQGALATAIASLTSSSDPSVSALADLAQALAALETSTVPSHVGQLWPVGASKVVAE